MSLINSTAIPSSASAFEVEQSLRFEENRSTYLSRFPSTSSNRKTWTFSCWLKWNGENDDRIFQVGNSLGSGNYFGISSYNAKLNIEDAGTFALHTSALLRDPSAWYHIVLAMDTTQATASNRLKLYVNGVQITTWANSETYPARNNDTAVNRSGKEHGLGVEINGGYRRYLDGYLADVNLIDGIALAPTAFGETGDYGEWKPKAYSGSYGSNGFYLPFTQDYTVEGFSTVTYKGTSANRYLGGFGFQPDLVWQKTRNYTYGHQITDSVRGSTKKFDGISTDAEATSSTSLTGFKPDGVTIGTDNGWNNSGYNQVIWAWDMGGSNANNTTGSINSVVRANPTYGQSIVSYTGTGSNATVGHGLSSAPEMIIVKNRSSTNEWITYHASLGNTKFLVLNSTAALDDAIEAWNDTTPTSNLFTVGTSNSINNDNMIAYCFHSVSGYSKFGSYSGNGSSGNAVTTGFQPAFVMIKRTDTANNWYIMDNVRTDSSGRPNVLQADTSAAETTENSITLTSTGFTINVTNNAMNASGGTYIYMAFADKREYAYWLDQSGNNNDWTSNNLTESDVMVDSPTNNFCTWNPLTEGINGVLPISNGNLEVGDRTNGSSGNGNKQTVKGTLGVSSGKWYIEFCKTNSTNDSGFVGVASSSINYNSTTPWNGDPSNNLAVGQTAAGFRINDGKVFTKNGTNSGITTSTGVSINQGNIYGIAFDLDNNQASFYINGTQTGSTIAFTVASSDVIMPLISQNTTWQKAGFVMNAGQDSSFAGLKTPQGNQDSNDIGDFFYAPPSGFLALCTKNLPDVAVVPSENFNTVLYTGTDATNSTHAITGIGFQPDWVWTKDRDATYGHYLFDAVRGTGVTKGLRSNTTNDEGMANESYDALSSFDSDGFTITGAAFGSLYQDRGSADYVSWNWKANGSGSSNTNGSINSTVSANVDAGFSIVSYTGTGSNATVGHGLSKAPDFFVTKTRNNTGDWMVYSGDATDFLKLNETNATEDLAAVWNDTSPTSSVFSLGTNGDVNINGRTYIAYCFHSVDGYSNVGSYTGNGSADGTFVYTGFRPAYVMVKRTDAANYWLVLDDTRREYNPNFTSLYPNSTSVEDNFGNGTGIDFLSNGFKHRDNVASTNASGGTYIYLAFAETPFKHSNGK